MEAKPSRHGYWGPLPGESPALYKALGAPTLERLILEQVPEDYRGEFNVEAGRDLGLDPPAEPPIEPAELSREERLQNLVRFTQANERAHVITFAFLGALSTWGAIEGGLAGTSCAVAIGAVNVATNIPPIIVQRYNRLRAYRTLDRISNIAPTL